MSERFHRIVRGDSHGPGPALARLGLLAASGPYGLAARLRNLAFDRGWKRSYVATAPVVSVGNLTAGGTGKTPCVEYIARFYRERGVRPVILSRGYGAASGPNDEALALEANLPDVPHLQGTDRVELARIAVEELEAELLILDDGFQHRRLRRDMDVVLIDATNPWGHGHLLPRGLLREPRSSLRRADAVVITRCDQSEADSVESRIRELKSNIPVVRSTHAPVEWLRHEHDPCPIETLHGRTVGAFCGVGNPGAFRRTLATIGVDVAAFRTFPDHHPYSRADVDDLRRWTESLPTDAAVVATQKDTVKLRLAELGGRELFALRVGLRHQPGPDLDALEAGLVALRPPD